MAREQFQTLSEPMYYILLALLEERCGVDIMDEVARISHGRISVGPGTLYAMLPKFESSGMIRQTRQEKRQKWYVVTEKGRLMLEEEVERLKQMLSDGAETFAPKKDTD
ncbi:MAG: helix-turn-helix transcriptional regulator [Lachnospiraceae bacterium]|nr:helix-turn-helix transcriptional regulator [Lachnospiraceae bacterium]